MMARDRAAVQVASRDNPNAVQDVTVQWYVDVLGFPESTAKALYTSQTLTDEQVLVQLTNKSVDNICAAIRKPGGASKGDPTPVLAIERLKLALFCLKLYERTSRDIPDMMTLTHEDLTFVEDQKREADEYVLNKDQRPELKLMSIDVHSAPTCFDKVRIILNAMQGCTGIPLTYVIRLNIKDKDEAKDPRFGQTDSLYGSFDEEMVSRAPIITHNLGQRTHEELEESGQFMSAFASDMKKVYLVLHSILGGNTA